MVDPLSPKVVVLPVRDVCGLFPVSVTLAVMIPTKGASGDCDALCKSSKPEPLFPFTTLENMAVGESNPSGFS